MSKKLDKRLLGYSTVAGAFLLNPTGVNATVHVNSGAILGTNPVLEGEVTGINFDGLGLGDIDLLVYNVTSFGVLQSSYLASIFTDGSSNAQPYVLSQQLKPYPFTNSNMYSYGFLLNTPSVNGTTKYYGLIFETGSGASYGWVQLKFVTDPNYSIEILGYAYNDVPIDEPGGSLKAGQTTDTPLPVELSSFTANVENSDVKLAWTTESEKDNLGFILERCVAGELDWHQVSSYKTEDDLKGHNTSTEKHKYDYTDRDVKVGETYQYRLSHENIDGQVSINSTISVTIEAVPTSFELKQNYPNPFNPTTTIDFSLNEKQNVTLSIYNMNGQLVQQLIDGELNAGNHSTEWNASNVPAGTYFYQLKTDTYIEIKKAVLIK